MKKLVFISILCAIYAPAISVAEPFITSANRILPFATVEKNSLKLASSAKFSTLTPEITANDIDFISGLYFNKEILKYGNPKTKSALRLALFDVLLNWGQFKSESSRLRFFEQRYTAYRGLDLRAFASVVANSYKIGFIPRVTTLKFADGETRKVMYQLPDYLTRDFDIEERSYDGAELEAGISLLNAGSASIEMQDRFNPVDPIFRSFLSSYSSLRLSNQLNLSAAAYANALESGVFPRAQLTRLISEARQQLARLDAELGETRNENRRKEIEKQIQKLSAQLADGAESYAALINVRMPSDAADGGSIGDENAKKQDEWKKFSEEYQRKSKKYYDTFMGIADLVSPDDPTLRVGILSVQILTNLAVAAGTQDYITAAAVGVQFAGQIFGTGSGGAQSSNAAILKYLAAIRRDIANLHKEMRARFERIEMQLDSIDRKLSDQFRFIIENFQFLADKIETVSQVANASSEEDYRYRQNELASAIDEFNSRYWESILDGKISTNISFELSTAIDTFSTTYLSTNTGTGLSHPRIVGPTDCWQRILRGLYAAQSTADGLKETTSRLKSSLRSPSFGKSAHCVNALFSTAAETMPRMRLEAGVENNGIGLPGFVDANGFFNFDGGNLLFSPQHALTTSMALNRRLLAIQDPDILRAELEKKITRLSDVTRNMALVGSRAGLEVQVPVYLSAVREYLRTEAVLYKTKLARALIRHGSYAEQKFLTGFGSIAGAYRFYRVPQQSILYQYHSGRETDPAFIRGKTLFENQRQLVKALFESEIRDLARDVDQIVKVEFGNYGGTIGSCSSIEECVTFAYATKKVDSFLAIDTVTVGLPSIVKVNAQRQAEIEILLKLITSEVEAAAHVFNEMGARISDYPKPAFGRSGPPYYKENPMPDEEVFKLERDFLTVISDFRARTKVISLQVVDDYDAYLRSEGTSLDDRFAQALSLFFAGVTFEKNFNELFAAYKLAGKESELKDANVAELNFFQERSATISHYIRSKCGAKVGEACHSPEHFPEDRYPLSAYLYPFMVGETPAKQEEQVLRLYYQQNDGTLFGYFLSKVWLSAKRDTRGLAPKEAPATSVSDSLRLASKPIFPNFDAEYMHTADNVHSKIHPGIVGAAKQLSEVSAIGAWKSELPGCRDQAAIFEQFPLSEQQLYKDAGDDPFADATPACELTSKVSRYLAMAYRGGSYNYLLNQTAVDYLQNLRDDAKILLLDKAIGRAVVARANALQTVPAYQEYLLKQIK